MTHEIRRTDAAFELLVDGVVAVHATYTDDGVVVALPHVETEGGFRGQGLAGELVGGILDRLRSDGRRVRPDCPFAAAFIRDHPRYADLVAD